jgi:hypothetical protein
VIKVKFPKGMAYPSYFAESDASPQPAAFLSQKDLGTATSRLPVVCTDVVLIDTQGRFVLAKRRNACGRGWWWKGGGLAQDKTLEGNIASILRREIGQVPESVVYSTNSFIIGMIRGNVQESIAST